MLCRRTAIVCCRRFSSESLGNNNRTAIILLHEGQPRTEFYAKDFIKDLAAEYYNIPQKFKGNIPEAFLVNDIVRKCVNTYGDKKTIEESLNKLAADVEVALNELLPEFSNIDVKCLFPSRTDAFRRSFDSILNSGINQMVLVPVMPHFSCSHTGILLNLVSEHLLKTTIPVQKDGKKLENIRIVPNSNASFEVSTLHRWSSNPVVAEYWISKIESCQEKYEGIVFASPAMRGNGRLEFQRSVFSSCERIANSLTNPVPWRLAFYNGWNEWCFPLSESLSSQIKKLGGKKPHDLKRLAVVPVTDLFPTFNTTTVLPNYILKHNSAFLIEPSEKHPRLEQGLAEVVKNHLLGRRNPQLSQYCDSCNRKSCEATRLILSY